MVMCGVVITYDRHVTRRSCQVREVAGFERKRTQPIAVHEEMSEAGSGGGVVPHTHTVEHAQASVVRSRAAARSACCCSLKEMSRARSGCG